MIHTITLFLLPGFQMLDLAALTVFDAANGEPGGTFYDTAIVSRQGGAVRGAAGADVDTRAWQAGRRCDTLLVVGGNSTFVESGTAALLHAAAGAARRVGSIGAGTDLLAGTGLLDGRRVALHAAHAPRLQATHPALHVDAERLYTHDGKYWTAAGMTATLDLALAMVEQDLGTAAALAVARRVMLYHWRSSAHLQSADLLDMAPMTGRIQATLTYARRHLRNPLSIDELADHAGMSRRHFTRTFRAETGQSPARAIETMRAEVARTLLESGALSLDAVARDAGFASAEQMRRALARVYEQTPQMLRRAARAA